MPIKCKWVYTIKQDENDQPSRFKARLVIKGCSQKKNIDYHETYAPVARLSTLRILLSLINYKNLIARQLDVKNAFLNGILKEEIYMNPPEGMHVKSGLVCKLNRTLYGLKQAPAEWNRRFDGFILKLGFSRCLADRCMYVYSKGSTVFYLLLYVDDIILAGQTKEIVDRLKSRLMSEFKMRDLGDLKYFLGIKISRKEGRMFLSQTSYIRSMLEKFNMSKCAPAKTPLVVGNIGKKGSQASVEGVHSHDVLADLNELLADVDDSLLYPKTPEYPGWGEDEPYPTYGRHRLKPGQSLGPANTIGYKTSGNPEARHTQ